jgi:hypothetical protein
MNECERDIPFMTFRKYVTISHFPFMNSCFTEIYKTNLSLLTLFLVLFCPIHLLLNIYLTHSWSQVCLQVRLELT